MCFPVNCLKSLLSAGTGITLVASILTIGFGFWTLYEADNLSKEGNGCYLNIISPIHRLS